MGNYKDSIPNHTDTPRAKCMECGKMKDIDLLHDQGYYVPHPVCGVCLNSLGRVGVRELRRKILDEQLNG